MQGFLEGDDELKAYEKKKHKAVTPAPATSITPAAPEVVQPPDLNRNLYRTLNRCLNQNRYRRRKYLKPIFQLLPTFPNLMKMRGSRARSTT